MKDNLLPFDLEEAKKDPSRVRFTDKAIAKEIHIFYNGRVSAVWEDGDFAIYADYTKLRLTPKRRFVKHDLIEKSFSEISHEEAIGLQKWGAKVFELIPVKEDE